jgi:hypothetical protein
LVLIFQSFPFALHSVNSVFTSGWPGDWPGAAKVVHSCVRPSFPIPHHAVLKKIDQHSHGTHIPVTCLTIPSLDHCFKMPYMALFTQHVGTMFLLIKTPLRCREMACFHLFEVLVCIKKLW